MRVALVNTNRMQPPIAPIGLDYVAAALAQAGHAVSVLDLCWEADWRAAVARFFAEGEFGLVGLTLRNTDDCAAPNPQSFLGDFAEIAREIARHAGAPLVAGGAGFSVMPEEVLAQSGTTLGVWGEGEFTLPELATRLETGQEWRDLPNLIWREGQWHRNPAGARDLSELPPMAREWIDNPRYFREGGQAGFETKRGCACACVYCADPLSKGSRVRLRPPAAAAEEVAALLRQGIDHLHTCDAEFNLPPEHAAAVGGELVARGLGERLRWYAYCSPAGFTRELAGLMRRAGCVGINFGVDSGDDAMLSRLRRGFTAADIEATAEACRQAGLLTMFDLLLGGPGETEESLARTIGLMKRLAPDRVGVAVGLRVYPGTQLAQWVEHPDLQAGLTVGQDPAAPLCFLEPAVGPRIFSVLDRLIAGDSRFLFFDPTRPDQNYNYNANARLSGAIRAGYRGAYWDILRRLQAGA